MTDNDVHSALASFQEVAVFAWSVIELLFTRILPLVGFFAAHLVLQAGHLVSEVLSPASHSPSAYRRRHLKTFWLSEEQQRRPWLEYSAADLASPRYTATTAPWSDSSLSGYNPPAASRYATVADAEALQEAQPLAEIAAEPGCEPSVAPQEAAAVSGYQEQKLSEPSAMQITVATRHLEDQAQLSSPQTVIASPGPPPKDLAVPKTAEAVGSETLLTAAEKSEEQHQQSAMPAGEAASVQVVQSAASTPEQKAIEESPKNTDNATGQPSDPRRDETFDASDSTTLRKKNDTLSKGRNPSMEGRVGRSDKPADIDEPVRAEQESSESIAVANASTNRQFTRGKSLSETKRHAFTKVLPPALSQIKRAIMPRSRRSSPALKSSRSYSW